MNWQSFFRAVQYVAPRLSHQNPEKGLVESNISGQWLLYHWDRSCGTLEALGPAAKMPFYELSPDGQSLVFLMDENGNDLGHYVFRHQMGDRVIDLTPDLPPYHSFAILFSRNGHRVGFTCASPAGFQTYLVDLDPNGQPVRRWEVYHTHSFITCPWLSADGKLAFLASTHFSGEMAFGLVVLEVDREDEVATLWDGAGNDLHPMIRSPFSPVHGDPRIITRANRSGLRRPVIWNPCTGERLDLAFEDRSGDIVPKDWSSDGRFVLLEQLDRAVQQLGIYDLAGGSTCWLDLPSGVYGNAQFGEDGQVIAQWEDLSHPSQVVAIHTAAGKVAPLLSHIQDNTGSNAWQSITFPSSDGQMVQAWLAVPQGDGPFPTIIEAHGGPEAVQTNGYHPEALAWLEQGFAFASINYRGSTTFGKAFQNQIKGDWGHWELEDLAACRNDLIQRGIANPDRVFLTGYSYGGYLTLMALGKQPELWCGGMAGGCIADWRMLYEDAAEPARQMARAFFGGSPEACPELYQRCSPVTYIHQVCAPVFIWMGIEDTQVPARQIEQYISQLRALGKRVDAFWYTGGHGGPIDVIDSQVETVSQKIAFVQGLLLSHP